MEMNDLEKILQFTPGGNINYQHKLWQDISRHQPHIPAHPCPQCYSDGTASWTPIVINSLWPSDANMVTWIWVNLGSGNGLLPDGTKPLPEPMLTDHK